jgi:hypothetical protein
MTQKRHRLAALFYQLERQMRDKRKTITVGGHQAGERVFAHDGRGVLGVVELLGQVHGDDCTKQRASITH